VNDAFWRERRALRSAEAGRSGEIERDRQCLTSNIGATRRSRDTPMEAGGTVLALPEGRAHTDELHVLYGI